MSSASIPFTRVRGGKLYLNLPVPADLRPHFLTTSGKPQTHIVEALRTGDPTEGRRLARIRAGHWEKEFARLRKGHRGHLPSDTRQAHAFREAMAQAQTEGHEAVFIVESLAADAAERIEAEAGADAARQFYEMASSPEKLTILQALARMNESPDIKEGTKRKREQAVRELLRFLKVSDCLPEHVTETRAVSYVDWLNAGKLRHSTKQDRLSNFQTMWRFLAQRRQLALSASPWLNHELTGRKRAAGGAEAKRGWRTDELTALFAAPDVSGRSHYGRPLFRELYALGLLTGMRLDEIVSLTPKAIEAEDGGYWISIEASKTDAGVRSIPVVHPAAVAIIKRRLNAKPKAGQSIFPECRPGGPDNKLSWHVQKALGRDRDRLGFGSEVDFHSTRRTFLTIMDNAGAEVVHVQRYVGHQVPSLMLSIYSDGSSRESLLKVARMVKYPAKVEAALAA